MSQKVVQSNEQIIKLTSFKNISYKSSYGVQKSLQVLVGVASIGSDQQDTKYQIAL